ncbi:hypothetical protein IQ251_01190 [Saccharopolyspora sp. HNM0983]|uniref:Uncharacterized protein n=1 Tax=Saccharopolyspora montiporae TaxID=2781240 RepID=A0A929B4J3_9PSEU|nr:hypothetical protein [Saccharopolyspora sp. HNM0983]MBE9373052.1 hypothetical protein [Saccharopolyspora sp. HNM0983]
MLLIAAGTFVSVEMWSWLGAFAELDMPASPLGFGIAAPLGYGVVALLLGTFLIRGKRARRPARWRTIGFVTGIPMALGPGAALALVLGPAAMFGFVGIVVLAMWLLHKAGRCVLHPLVAELGLSPIHVQLPLRLTRTTANKRNIVTVDEHGLELSVGSGSLGQTRHALRNSVPLPEVQDVRTAPAAGTEPLWPGFPPTRGVFAPAGQEVVWVRTERGDWVVPVDVPREFAEVLRRRIRWAAHSPRTPI